MSRARDNGARVSYGTLAVTSDSRAGPAPGLATRAARPDRHLSAASADRAGPPGRPDLGPGLRLALEFLGQPQQRVGRAVDDFLGDVDDPAPPGPRRGAQQVEGVPGPQPVPL